MFGAARLGLRVLNGQLGKHANSAADSESQRIDCHDCAIERTVGLESRRATAQVSHLRSQFDCLTRAKRRTALSWE